MYDHLPFVSIVVPVYNEQEELPILLDSLMVLDWPADRLEILCIDNGSMDRSLEIMKSYPAVTVLSEARPGAYAARNLGIRASKGEFVAFTDADCEVDPHWLIDLYPAFEDPTVGAVGGAIAPQPATNFVDHFEGHVYRSPNHSPGTSRTRPYLVTANAIFRRAVFDRIGLFDEERFSGPDVEISWRLLNEGTFGIKIFEQEQGIVRHRCRSNFQDFTYVRRRDAYGWYYLTRQYPQMAPVPRLERYFAKVVLGALICPWTTLGRLGLAVTGQRSFRDVPTDLMQLVVLWNHLVGTARARLVEAGWQPTRLLR